MKTLFIILVVASIIEPLFSHSSQPSTKQKLSGIIKFCPYTVQYEDKKNGKMEFIITGKAPDSDYYLSFGLSKDKLMGDDSVLACIHFGGNVTSRLLYNVPNRKTQPKSLAALSLQSGSYMNGILSCHITHDVLSTNPQIFDLTKDWYVFFAHGKTGSATNVYKHREFPKISAEKVDLQNATTALSHSGPLAYRKAHACLMLVAWVLCSSLGAALARHYKPMWPSVKILSKPIWFQAHRVAMLLAVLCTCISFIIIFVDVNGYSSVGWESGGKLIHRAHPILGIIVTALALINPTMALFRPHPGEKYRPLFNYAHWSVGSLARIGGVITIFIGFDLSAWVSGAGIIVMGIFLAYEVLMEVAMEIVGCMSKNTDAVKGADLELKPEGSTDTAVTITHPPKHGLRSGLFVAHILVLAAFTIALIVIVAIGSSGSSEQDLC